MSGIYKILNTLNNKIYIGSALDFRKRWNSHRHGLLKNVHDNQRLQKAVNKYGLDNFQFEVIEECEPEKCIEREQYYIDTLKPEYNLCLIAGNTFGKKHSFETRLKISQSLTGKKLSEAHKRNITLAQLGIKHKKHKKHPPFTEEQRKNLSLAKRGQKYKKCLI
jgi:group I intron endonuclease